MTKGSTEGRSLILNASRYITDKIYIIGLLCVA